MHQAQQSQQLMGGGLDLTNALKIRRNKEVCIYRTAKPEDKKALLAAFRQVSQELGEKKRKDNEKEQERRKSIWQGDAGISLSDMKYLLTTRSDCSWQPRSTPPGIIEPRPTVIEYWYLCDRLKRFAVDR